MGRTKVRVAASARVIERARAFTDADWDELALALGRVFNEGERKAIHNLTEYYLNFHSQEGDNIASVEDVCKSIGMIRKNSDEIISDLTIDYADIEVHNTAIAHAVSWIRNSQEGGAALIGEVQVTLRKLIVSCDLALEGRPKATDHGYQAGDAWKHAVRMMHITFYPNRTPGKGIGNNAHPMRPFVRFIDAWQNLLPGEARKNCAETNLDALHAAVNRAIKGKRAVRGK